MATEIQLNLLARYQRNARLNITEMGGTMASELSRKSRAIQLKRSVKAETLRRKRFEKMCGNKNFDNKTE